MDNEIDLGKAWDKISDSYQKRYKIGTSEVHWGPLCPLEKDLHLLGEVNKKKIIEIGSGAGQNSITLSKKGAITTALDISKEQLNYGRLISKEEGVNINFVNGDFESIDQYFQDKTFDIAFSAYALQYCMTLDSMRNTFKQIYNILKDNGKFVFSLDHPVRTIGHWNSKDNFILDNYFNRDLTQWDYAFPETGISAKMQGSFKTVSDYVNAVIDSGFKLEKLLEPEPIEQDDNSKFGVNSRYGLQNKRDPYSFDHLSRIPGTLIIKAKKN